jgi:ATP-binding cassette, subfamily B, bacterial
LKLLGGMLEADRGTLNTESCSALQLSAIHSAVIMIPQEPEIFAQTFRYNLTMDEDFSQSQLDQVLNLACLKPVLERLNGDWETDLASRGLNLSVGEKQRVALARGLLRAQNRDIILLDEPTSSLDPGTENAIFTGLLKHFRERTIITACHRLKIVPLFDRVMYVRGGHVLEIGTFQDLVRRGGYFATAWENYQQSFAGGELHL